jgi:DNA polymerase III delta prime subunit
MEYVDFDKKSDDFTVKYAPTKVSEIVGCERQVSMLSNWLKNYEENGRAHRAYMKQKEKSKTKRNTRARARKINSKDSKGGTSYSMGKKGKKSYEEASCALITGDHGCGKTSIIKAVFNSYGYKIRTVNFAKLTSGNIESFTHSLLDCDGVYTFVNEQDNETTTRDGRRIPAKIAIIIDEVESVSSNNEKNLINTLLQINAQSWKAPVVFISNNKHKKLITTLKKECFHVHIYEPEVEDMLNLLVRIGVGEKMQMEDESIAHSIIEHSGFDYRKMVSTLQMLCKVYGTDQIDNQKLESYLKFTDQRDVDRTIYENTAKLFTEFQSIENALRVFEGDKVNMPLMVHQNHFLALSGYVKNDDDKLRAAEEITESLANGDIIENYIYSDQNWGLQEVQGHYSCVFPSYQVNQVVNTEKLKTDSKYPFYQPAFKTDFPKDLNRTSTRKINLKNIKFASEFFNDMTVSDYVRANQIIRQLLGDGRVDECGELIDRYNLTHTGVMYILKIDKVTGTKKVISKDIDKMIKQITIEPVEKSKVTKTKIPKKTTRSTTRAKPKPKARSTRARAVKKAKS